MNHKMKLTIQNGILQYLKSDIDVISKFSESLKAFIYGLFYGLGLFSIDIDVRLWTDKSKSIIGIEVSIDSIFKCTFQRTQLTDWQIIGVDKEKETHDRANKYPELSIPQE